MGQKVGSNEDFMRLAISLSAQSVERGGGPFGAVIVRNGEILAEASNCVTINNDPTAHAEVMAIREACRRIKNFKLDDCEIYSSCEPCPMCLSAIYWAGITKIYFANRREDARDIAFDDSSIYDQIPLDPALRRVPSQNILRSEAIKIFRAWEAKADKIRY